MKLFPDIQTFIEVGVFSIKWYAVLILLGIAGAYIYSSRRIKKMGYFDDILEDLLLIALPCGIVGARIWYVLFSDLSGYLAKPISIFYVWEGGLAIQGAIVGALLATFWYAKKHKLAALRLIDAIIPSMLLAQAVGRWGNFLNQEAYGPVVSESYYNGFPAFIKQQMLIYGEYRMPMFLIESITNLTGFILIAYVFKRWGAKRRGDLLYAYLMWYGATRYFVEIFRTDSLMLGAFKMAQLTSLVFVVIGLAGLLGVFTKWFKKSKPIILFDLDGTVADTRSSIIAAFDRVFTERLPQVDLNSIDRDAWIGPPLAVTFGQYTDEVEPLVELYIKYNQELQPSLIKPITNIPTVLASLKQDGYRLGIVSSKRHQGIEYSLGLCQLQDYFDVIVGVDDVKAHKPHPEGILKACELLKEGHDSVIYVGDSVEDIKAAQAAGVYSVAYLDHASRKAEMQQSGANAQISDMLELLTLVKEDHEWTNDLM
jgi:phosphatidylglycerol---prolipoprotein diacylglyceryl transferase